MKKTIYNAMRYPKLKALKLAFLLILVNKSDNDLWVKIKSFMHSSKPAKTASSLIKKAHKNYQAVVNYQKRFFESKRSNVNEDYINNNSDNIGCTMIEINNAMDFIRNQPKFKKLDDLWKTYLGIPIGVISRAVVRPEKKKKEETSFIIYDSKLAGLLSSQGRLVELDKYNKRCGIY
jgi:hypothetical protein